MSHESLTDRLDPYEDPLSEVADQGWTIAWDCEPRVGKGRRLFNSIKQDPEAVAHRIANSAIRKGLSFVRWRGNGDLFAEAIPCIEIASTLMPDVEQWVESRKTSLASLITPASNVCVMLTIDESSWHWLYEMRQQSHPKLRWFWIYEG